MNRFLIYCLTAVTLFLGVTRFVASDKMQSTTVAANADNQKSDRNLFYFSSVDYGFVGGTSAEQFRLQNLFQQTSFRLLSYSSNALRVANSVQLSYRQYLVSASDCMLRSAFKQLDGYYLYFLRKILI